jgi:hypothetical protein
MIVDLVAALNYLKQAHKVMTYKSVLFPAPALVIGINELLVERTCQWFRKHTFAVNPQERTSRVPVFQRFGLEKPCSGFTISCFRDEVVVRRRVRGREPILNVRFQLATYKIPSVSAIKGEEKQTNASSCLLRLTLGEERLRPQVSTGNNYFARDTYPNRFEYYPLMPHDLTERVSGEYIRLIVQVLRTFHNLLHITHKTMHHTQRLCNGYPSLILC